MSLARAARTAAVDVLLCRGCCCGSAAKRPGTDHPGQLSALAEAVEDLPAANLVVTDCLGPCELANVVVVRTRGRLPGERRTAPVWFGNVTDPSDTADLCAWVRQLGLGVERVPHDGPLPAALESLRIPTPGPRRAARTRTRAATA
ncbi:hypothetical protein [Saccharothrix sp. ST-888]|uniref:hypothetical protein n=1 Tax=Saccharothrix sp. ST-888 TaxID=1427391 RepID=UPI0005EC2A5C|nr:hypothetical protein [Saccharothrix sp. ST-888]